MLNDFLWQYYIISKPFTIFFQQRSFSILFTLLLSHREKYFFFFEIFLSSILIQLSRFCLFDFIFDLSLMEAETNHIQKLNRRFLGVFVLFVNLFEPELSTNYFMQSIINFDSKARTESLSYFQIYHS